MNSIEIFLRDQLVVAKYYGKVSMEDVIGLTMEMVVLPGFSPSLNGVTDYRGARVDFTLEEVREFAKAAVDDNISKGNWCMLVDEPMTTAMLTLFKDFLKGQHPIKVFSTVVAASDYLHTDLSQYFQESE